MDSTSTARLEVTNQRFYGYGFADHAVETITSLKNLRMVDDPYTSAQVSVAPDGSSLFTRDTGTQEIYALSVKWP